MQFDDENEDTTPMKTDNSEYFSLKSNSNLLNNQSGIMFKNMKSKFFQSHDSFLSARDDNHAE